MVWFGELGGMMVHKKLLTVIRGVLLVTPGSWPPALIKVPHINRKPMQLWIQGSQCHPALSLSHRCRFVLAVLNSQVCNHTFSISPIFLTHFPPLWMSAHSQARSPAAGIKRPIGWQHAQFSLAFPLISPLEWIIKWKWPQGFTGPPWSAHSSFSHSPVRFHFKAGEASPSPKDAACPLLFFFCF